MIPSLDHIHLYAESPDDTLAFYVRAFGAEHLGALPNGAGGDNHVLLLGGQVLVVSAFPHGMEPQPAPEAGPGALRSGFGVAHFGLQTRDLDALLEQLEAQGVRPQAPPAMAGSIRYVYVQAPDGVMLELLELVLSPKLRKLKPAFEAYNKAIHVSKRLFLRQLVKAPSRSVSA